MQVEHSQTNLLLPLENQHHSLAEEKNQDFSLLRIF